MKQVPVKFDAPEFAADLGRALAHASGIAVLVVDSDLVVQDANGGARAVLGDALRPGSPLASSVEAQDLERVAAAAGGSTDSSIALLRSASSPGDPSRALVVSLVPVDGAQGPHLAMLGRPATAELEREARVLQARRFEIVGQLTSGVAHDLNNRLSTVTTFSDLMLGDADPGSQDAEDLAEIKQAGLDSAEITRKLDLFAGGHAGGETDCSLPDVVRGFEKLIRRFVGGTISLEMELDDSCHRVATPPIRLEEVLIALVANARDAMPEGGTMTLRAAAGSPEDPAGSAVLEVRDTGREEVLPPMSQALEPFFSSKPHGVGSGLGLATVHGIVSELGGTLTLTRTEGATVARVILPGMGTDRPTGADEEATGGGKGTGPVRIGLVEPDETGRRALARGLARGGAEVVAAATVAELGPDAFPFDAVVLDVPDERHAADRLVAGVRAYGAETPIVLLRRRSSPRVAPPEAPYLVELAKPTDLARVFRALRMATGPDARGLDTR